MGDIGDNLGVNIIHLGAAIPSNLRVVKTGSQHREREVFRYDNQLMRFPDFSMLSRPSLCNKPLHSAWSPRLC